MTPEELAEKVVDGINLELNATQYRMLVRQVAAVVQAERARADENFDSYERVRRELSDTANRLKAMTQARDEQREYLSIALRHMTAEQIKAAQAEIDIAAAIRARNGAGK